MGFIYTIVDFFQSGGTFMYPILIVFALGVAISAERFVKLAYVRRSNQKMWDQLHPVLAEGDFDTARQMTAEDESNSAIAHLMSIGLAR